MYFKKYKIRLDSTMGAPEGDLKVIVQSNKFFLTLKDSTKNWEHAFVI